MPNLVALICFSQVRDVISFVSFTLSNPMILRDSLASAGRKGKEYFFFLLQTTTWTSPHSSPVACQEESENDVVADQEDDLSNHNGNVMKAVMDL